jgi:hypothetical protein
MTLLSVLPLTFVMIAGPQIISAVFLATSHDWGKNSAAYVAGAALSITIIFTAAYFATKGAKGGGSSSKGSTSQGIEVVVIVLLLFLVVQVYRKRNEPDPPKWMGKLETANPRFSFTLGFLLLGVFPTDIVTSITVGSHLANDGQAWYDGLVFVGVTLFWLALPALLVVLLGKRARELLPTVRDWMNTNSWIVSEIVIVFFIVITINSIASA